MWQPTATIENLKKRAQILRQIREFFFPKNVLEVETPLLSEHTVTDPYLHSIKCTYQKSVFYLQTSPEYHMKRLLAAGSGSIFQISKSFRADEQGRLHNPEFTMLEWYRVGFNHHALMDEVEVLLQTVLLCQKAQRFSYQSIFQKYCAMDPLSADIEQLKTVAKKNDLNTPDLQDDKDMWLMFLFNQLIEPKLQALTFIYDFPASQAALAKINPKDLRVAERFEVYCQGIELANGFHELVDVEQQRERFIANQQQRKKLGYADIEIDENFLQALQAGLPDCAGVALGIDRLIMLMLGAEKINDVISFGFEHC